MQKTLVWAAIALIALAFIVVATPGAVASPGDELIIPVNTYINFSNNLTVHLIQVTISNSSYYSTYSPDTANSTWPVLVFQYENYGKAQVACRFHVVIEYNKSGLSGDWVSDKTDDTVYQPLYPGQKSSVMTMEFAMPNDRKLTNLSIIDDWLKDEIVNIPIVYPTPTPLPTPTPVPPTALESGDNFRNLMLIPILLGLVGLVGYFMARKRLF